MILPILKYGNPLLRAETVEVHENTPDLQTLIDAMIDTMHGASGIGIAAPQVGRSERLFVIDLSPLAEDLLEEIGEVPDYARGPVVFLNPEVFELNAPDVEFEEGCLSIPEIRERVERPDGIRITFQNRDLGYQEMEAHGFLARVIQHEFDHLNGVLFIDHLSPIRRRLLQRRLRAVARGEVETDYPMV
jgi:peptide deformylase